MKNKWAFFCFAFLLILSGVCSALTTEDNGYAWNAATFKEKKSVETELQRLHLPRENYTSWIPILDKFYDTADKNILSMKIIESTPIMKVVNFVPPKRERIPPSYPTKSVGINLRTNEEFEEGIPPGFKETKGKVTEIIP